MQQILNGKSRTVITFSRMSLAIYRELAAHVEQIEGVKANLITQNSDVFDYNQSQVEAILIEHPLDFEGEKRQQLEAILKYYKCRYDSVN